MNILKRTHSNQSGFTAIEIIIALIVIGAIAGVGFVVISRRPTSGTTARNTPTVNTPATEADSCFGVSKATIKSLLGDAANSMTGPEDTGVQDVPGGDKAQTCVYPFVAGATAENSFMIDLGTYANQANLDNSQRYITETGAAVTGVGESASFLAKDVPLTNTRDFALKVQQGLKIYTFEISQPNSSLTFNDASAQEALIKIAQAATL
ncbi:MAG: prepilin-type N-terminal cleavage/methylation domain-containing protein [Candidatus Saccharimonadales bacterium]